MVTVHVLIAEGKYEVIELPQPSIKEAKIFCVTL